MGDTMTIGDFSRATRLTAKALRFYHQAGLLEPAWVDPANGYRVYLVEQIANAQLVRHFRSLEMPVGLIREVLAADDTVTRNHLIAQHLATMEAQLELTRSAVASLRTLLASTGIPPAVTRRSDAARPALVIRGTIDLAELGDWYTKAASDLADAIATVPGAPAGPRGGIWGSELFLDERGAAALFAPITSLTAYPAQIGRTRCELLPAMHFAVATHRGADETIGQVYGALGEYVTRNDLGTDGPIREYYLKTASADDDEAITEICWPISDARDEA